MLRLLIIFIFSTLFLHAEPTKGILYTLKKDDHTAYLLGSIHALKTDFYPLPEPINKAFEGASGLVLESDFDDFDEDTMREISQMMENEKIPLLQRTPKHLHAPLKVFLEAVPELNYYTHWAMSFVLISAQLEMLDFRYELGIDQHFFQKAKAKELPIYSLESPLNVFKIFADLDHNTSIAMLEESIKSQKAINEELERLLNAWEQGDSEAVFKHTKTTFSGDSMIYHRLLTQRNYAMAQRIDHMLKEFDHLFIVVGAAHVGGPNGIPKLLAKKGIHITQY